MKFRLTDVMRTGIEELDHDHANLIAEVNAIAELEQAGDTSKLVAALGRFKTALARHFEVEEILLRAAYFPEAHAHEKHHADMIALLDRLRRDVANGKLPNGEIARVCYHELVTLVLLKDMQFINWLADRKRP